MAWLEQTAILQAHSPLGIFCSSLKTGLRWMRALALKKCIAGGNHAPSISFSFSWRRRASSLCSSAVSTTLPPVCLSASSSISRSLCAGSGIAAASPANQSSGTQVRRARQTDAAMSGCDGQEGGLKHGPAVSTESLFVLLLLLLWGQEVWETKRGSGMRDPHGSADHFDKVAPKRSSVSISAQLSGTNCFQTLIGSGNLQVILLWKTQN